MKCPENVQLLIQRAWACWRAWELCLLESPSLGRSQEPTPRSQENVKNARGVKIFHFTELGGNCLPSQQGPSLPGSHSFTSCCKSRAWAAPKEKFQQGKQSQSKQHQSSWAGQALGITELPIKKTLTNILPRFNVHLFLTRGTYSIKISYWINDIH